MHLNYESENYAVNSCKVLRAVAVLACASAMLGMPSRANADVTIPDDLPNVSYIDRSDFSGINGAPINSGPSGFGLGMVESNDEVQATLRSRPSGNWLFGLIVSKDRSEPARCGWIEAKIMSTKKVYTLPTDPCIEYWGKLKDPNNFGKDFNCPVDGSGTNDNVVKCVDGAKTTIKAGRFCNRTAFGNYAYDYKTFNNLTYPDTRGGFYDRLRKLEPGETVYYRYTTLDDKAAYVRTVASDGKMGGWAFVDSDCIKGTPQGGTKKTSDTVAGAHPNKSKGKSMTIEHDQMLYMRRAREKVIPVVRRDFVATY